MGRGSSQIEQQTAQIVRKRRAEQRQHQQLRTLRMLDCLRTVPDAELELLIDHCTFRAFLAHETIIHEGNQGRFLYLLLQGSVSLTLHDKEGNEVLLHILEQGDCFGEDGLSGDFFRRAGAYAETPCYVVQLPLADVRAMLDSTPALQTALRGVYLHRLAESTLGRVPLFSSLPPVERLALVALLRPESHPRDRIVVSQGTRSDGLYLVQAGDLVVEQDGQTINTINEGDFFGEISLLTSEPRSASVRAVTSVELLVLPAEAFHRLLARRPHLRAQLDSHIQRRHEIAALFRDDEDLRQRVNISLQRGLLRGSHLLVYDPARCMPGCRACETACIARHGHQRLSIDGVMFGELNVIDTCRQCRIGAECVTSCPEHAFVWNARGALSITDACTGCGECVSACPYDAVQRVPRYTSRFSGVVRSVREWARKLDQAVIPLEEPEKTYTHRADKCDLCYGYDDLACVSACPNGALRLVPVEEMLPM